MVDKRQQRGGPVPGPVSRRGGGSESGLVPRLPHGLAPDRHGGDFFVCDILEALPKDDMASMEHPLFSLATRPDRRILDYAHNGVRITVVPSMRGLATLFDKDILIYCISQLVAALNAGRPVGRELRLTAHDLMLATNRETSGDGYARLREAFERLAGTRITTNLVTGDQEVTTGFGLIEGWQIVRATPAGKRGGGRMVQVSVTLSDWLYRAVLAKSVLTLSRDYFRLRKPLERRVYELARKHCGRQPDWRISIPVLAHKSGSASPLRVFRRMIRDMVAEDHLPDYALAEEPGDILHVRRRDVVVEPQAGQGALGQAGPVLKSATLETARAMMPGWDIYALEADWRAVWHLSGRPALRSPDAAFIGWLKKRG
jgi:plasmid replication initiation protein